MKSGRWTIIKNGITLTCKKEISMRITAKGQVTIPREIRERMGLLPETEVEFEVRESEVILKKAGPGKATRMGPYLSILRGSKEVSMSTDEIMKLTRGEENGDG